MKKISALAVLALAVSLGATAPSFAKGGGHGGAGGLYGTPALAAQLAEKAAAACKADETKCIGFGTDYPGK